MAKRIIRMGMLEHFHLCMAKRIIRMGVLEYADKKKK